MNQSRRIISTGVWLTSFAILASAPSVSDDRDLLRNTSEAPYVFILFDVSGSMNWSPQCTAEQLSAGVCNYLCPNSDCTPRGMGDDPASKMVQAKRAIHQVLNEVDNVHFGFATYNQDNLRATYKHWLYRARTDGVALAGGEFWPRAEAIETFGQDFGCDRGDGSYEISCYAGTPADLDDVWEVERALRGPKLGVSGNDTDYIFVRTSGTRYRIRYDRQAGTLGDPTISVRYRAERCNNSDCSSRTLVSDVVVELARVRDFLHWETGASGNRSNWRSFFPGQSDHAASNTCSGWDPNTDPSADTYTGVSPSLNLKQVTNTSDPRGGRFHVGDVIPLDWNTKNKELIQSRLAPDGVNFGQASYFFDTPSDGILRLRNPNQKPLIAQGSTPLGHSMRDFLAWYDGTSTVPGWADIAAQQDPSWVCRRKYLLIVTDGDETCSGTPVAHATSLNREGNDRVRTYVVGFGLRSSDSLSDIAEAGGTGEAIFPENQDDLVTALTNILGEIQEETRAFAAATVPSVQADISDRLYVSRFVPLNGASVWPGALDAFIKPLRLDDLGQPDTGLPCGPDRLSGCFLWDAAEVLKTQTGIGLEANRRRVFYLKDPSATAVPTVKLPFSPPPGDPGGCAGYPPVGCSDWWDLFHGLGLDPSGAPDTLANRATNILTTTLGTKTGEYVVTRADGTEEVIEVSYVLGDLFHSDPTYVERPLDFDLYARNLYGNLSAPTATCGAAPPNHDRGYACYAETHRNRRKTLLVGANDGMLHAFDAGTWEGSVDDGEFNAGTGRELFAIVPRAALPVVREQATGTEQIYSMDAPPRVGDAYIDPRHNGTPTPDDREWRTVLVMGMREGGNKFPSQDWVARFEHHPAERMRNSYIAVDITQPDIYDSDGLPTSDPVPSCLRLDESIPAGCGSTGYPSVLWEYRDEHRVTRVSMDEDINGRPDLGDTWSSALLGRVRTSAGNREVAVFGGGMDTPFKAGTIGNWLYMVDIETGQTIYKRRVIGSVPAEVTGQDRDNDGFLDTLYFGTTAGLLYKVNVSTAGVFSDVTARDLNGTTMIQPRITSVQWDPFPIFQTGPAGSPGPIFHPPTVFYLARVGAYAVAFGTGDRENLWSETYGPGRFYVIRDSGFSRDDFLSGTLPKQEADYLAIDPDALPVTGDVVSGPASPGGWYFTLLPNERVITRAAGLVGLVSFTSFQPQTEFVDVDEDELCARTGLSRIFVVDATNGNSLRGGTPTNPNPDAPRYREVRDFATPPTLEQMHTKNQPTDDDDDEPWDEEQLAIIAAVQRMFPDGTRFGNYYYQLVQRTSRNEQIAPIPIPIGIMISNWKEF